MTGGYFFGPPRRASWPGPVTKLERIAFRLGMDDEEPRELLRGAIQAKLRARGEAWDKLDVTLEKRANRNGRG